MAKIMVVDDEKPISGLIEKILKRDGHEVSVSDNPLEALTIFDNTFVIVITDFDMPGMNGLEMAEKMREIYPEIEVIFISGVPYNVEQCKKKGFKYFLEKPFSMKVLKKLIEEILKG